LIAAERAGGGREALDARWDFDVPILALGANVGSERRDECLASAWLPPGAGRRYRSIASYGMGPQPGHKRTVANGCFYEDSFVKPSLITA